MQTLNKPNATTMQLTNYCKDLENLLFDVKGSISKLSTDGCCKNCEALKTINEEIEKKISNKDITSPNVPIKLQDAISETDNTIDVENKNKYLDEITDLHAKVKELEDCVDLLRNEYEKCEDYWASKLDEERQMFEKDQSENTEKLNDLLAKIFDYEKQFAIQDETDNRLPPIEEKYNLETQFTELEQEYDDYKLQAEMQLEEKNKEIFLLQEKLTELSVKSTNTKDIDVQVDFTEQIARKTLNKKMSNLSNHVIESTNLFAAETVPFNWNIDPNQQEVNCLEPPIESSIQRNSVNPEYHWNKSTFSEDGNTAETVSLNYSVITNSSNGEPAQSECSSTSLPTNMTWQTTQQNTQINTFALQNSPAVPDNSPQNSKTPIRPKRTRKYNRNPLGTQRVSRRDNQEKEHYSESISSFTSQGTIDGRNRVDDENCVVKVYVLKNLNAYVHHLEQRCQHLQMVLKQHHYRAEQMLQRKCFKSIF